MSIITLPEKVRNLRLDNSAPTSLTIKWDAPVVSTSHKYKVSISGSTPALEDDEQDSEWVASTTEIAGSTFNLSDQVKFSSTIHQLSYFVEVFLLKFNLKRSDIQLFLTLPIFRLATRSPNTPAPSRFPATRLSTPSPSCQRSLARATRTPLTSLLWRPLHAKARSPAFQHQESLLHGLLHQPTSDWTRIDLEVSPGTSR